MATNNHLVLLLTTLTVATLINTAQAVTCYDCSSLTNAECLDPFKNSSSLGTCTTEAGIGCSKVKATEKGVFRFVERRCDNATNAFDSCGSMVVEGVTLSICICVGDLCNSSQQLHCSTQHMLAALLALLFLSVYNNASL